MTTKKETQTQRAAKAPKEHKDDRYELRLSGSGGHGVILAAVILAQAIGADGKRNVVQTQSYGPEARGGASRSDVVVAEGDIYYPKTMKLDMLLAFTQEACDKYVSDLKADGILVVDTTQVTKIPTKKSYGFPFMRTAREEIGQPMVANVVALGAIAELTGVVSYEALKTAVLERAPKGTEETNVKALDLGFEMARNAKKH